MRSLALSLATLAMSSVSYAANIDCNGSYMGYDFKVQTSYTHNSVGGPIQVTVLNDGSTVKQETLNPTQSDIRPGQYVKFAGASSDGSGSIDANYDNSSGTYIGTMEANTSSGSADVDVTCTLN